MLGLRKKLVGGGAALLATVGFTLLIASAPAQTSATLPDDHNSFTVEAQCGFCHDPSVITRGMGYTREGWAMFIANMAPSTPDVDSIVLDYLSEHFPPSYNPRPSTIVEGPLQVSFQEWIAPTAGQRVRDPVQAPDGMIWYVGQRSNTIGRINPETNQIREWTLPENALPHSVNADAQGGIWYMGNGNGTIGRFDPETGQAATYNMPDSAARDPHTAEFDANGIMWFTLQQSNMIGRFDPSSGNVRLARIGRERARPYGIQIDANGTPWVSCNGSNCLIRVNPQTMALTEIDLPEGSTSRRLDIAEDGMVWYVNSSLGRLGRFNPQTGEINEWNSPSGANSHPYAIAVIDGIIWYNESAVRPDPLVRFDPRTETFQSWPIPSGDIYAGMVRHMRPTADGRLLLHQDATNRVILATLPPAN